VLNAPICWVGGKSRLRKDIIRRLPDNTCYVEVFGGAGWVLFGKEPSKVEVYNDIDGDLVNFFRVVKTCHRAFVQAFDWILVSRRLFKEFAAKKPEELDEIERAVRMYYIIRCSFGGKFRSPSFGYSKQSPSRLNLDTLYETISAVHNRLRRVYIEEESFEGIVSRYDGSGTVFYLDPPYYGTSCYRYNFEHSDYERLRDTLRSIEGRFLLSINDHEAVREIFKGFEIEEVEVPYSIGKNFKRFGELLVRNW